MIKINALRGNNIDRVPAKSVSRFSLSSITPYFLVLLLYVLWVTFIIGEFRRDHLILISGVSFAYFIHDEGRKMVFGFLFLILYWIIFDSVRAFPNYEYMPIHIGDLYQAELKWFGIDTPAGRITANEYFGKNNSTFLDIYSAFIYICWIPIPFAFGVYLFFAKHRKELVHYLFAFLMVSVIGLIFQYIYPAAAPWYVDLYGIENGFQKVPGNPGRLIKFDEYFGVNVFSNMYSLNANVYAAVPSKHCAFPVVSLFFAMRYRFKFWSTVFAILMLSTWFSAVYTNHHYIIDVISGIFTALLTIGIYLLLMKTRIKDWLEEYIQRKVV